jgi:PAS domain S-box-containing protein
VESRYRTKGGQLLPVEVTFNYLQYGGQAYNFVFARDISWRHWAVEAIRDSEQRLADIINFLPDPTFVIDEESKVIAWNRAMEELTGIKAEAILGKGDYEYALPFYGKRRPILIDLALHPDAEMERQYTLIERDRDNLIGEVHIPPIDQRRGVDAWIKARPLYDVQGNVTGAIETIRDITDRKRAAEALAVTNHQLQSLNDRLQGELTLAHKIQQGLLLPPQPYPNLVCYSSPAREVGGDFYMYHVFESPTQAAEIGTMAVAVGDVSGKGMPAALLMAVSLTALQSMVAQAIDPAALLVQLDRVIAPYTQATRQNCALCYMVIASQANGTAQVRVANAGCVAPLIRRAGGRVEWVEVGGLPLGVGLGAQLGYPEANLNLRPGELVLLTSDGLVEATDEAGNLFGFERLAQVVAQGPQTDATAMLAHLQAEVAAFTGQTEPHDDLTIVVLQV